MHFRGGGGLVCRRLTCHENGTDFKLNNAYNSTKFLHVICDTMDWRGLLNVPRTSGIDITAMTTAHR